MPSPSWPVAFCPVASSRDCFKKSLPSIRQVSKHEKSPQFLHDEFSFAGIRFRTNFQTVDLVGTMMAKPTVKEHKSVSTG